jgi:hypothetical protein
MKSRAAFFVLIFLWCSLWLFPLPLATAQGQLRAMEERADTVSKRKNRFVTRILDQHKINYLVDRHGIITRISVTGNWLEVMRLDVIPMVKVGGRVDEVVGHEIFIYAEGEVVRLISHLKAR